MERFFCLFCCTPDGENEFHGIGQVVYQQAIDEHDKSPLNISREHTKSFKHDPFIPAQICHKPLLPNKTYRDFIPPDLADFKLYQNLDSLWFLCRSLNTNTEVNIPTWAAYNSLITEALPLKNDCGLPLYPGSSTDWTNLYAALKICQNISVSVISNRKTIISLDLQLYAKAMQLKAKQDINENFVFRLGELQIVFAFLKTIGKYIECS